MLFKLFLDGGDVFPGFHAHLSRRLRRAQLSRDILKLTFQRRNLAFSLGQRFGLFVRESFMLLDELLLLLELKLLLPFELVRARRRGQLREHDLNLRLRRVRLAACSRRLRREPSALRADPLDLLV